MNPKEYAIITAKFAGSYKFWNGRAWQDSNQQARRYTNATFAREAIEETGMYSGYQVVMVDWISPPITITRYLNGFGFIGLNFLSDSDRQFVEYVTACFGYLMSNWQAYSIGDLAELVTRCNDSLQGQAVSNKLLRIKETL